MMGANIKRTSERIDPNGNIINPKTKQIIQENEQEYIPPVIPQQPIEAIKSSAVNTIDKVGTLSILEQIDEAKMNLANLEELKKLKIAEKKKELELLEQ